MKNFIQKYRQISIFFKKQEILSEKSKTLTSSNYHRVKFLAEILYTFPTYQCLKKDVQDFFVLFRTWVICKNLKRPGFYTIIETMFFTFLLIT